MYQTETLREHSVTVTAGDRCVMCVPQWYSTLSDRVPYSVPVLDLLVWYTGTVPAVLRYLFCMVPTDTVATQQQSLKSESDENSRTFFKI